MAPGFCAVYIIRDHKLSSQFHNIIIRVIWFVGTTQRVHCAAWFGHGAVTPGVDFPLNSRLTMLPSPTPTWFANDCFRVSPVKYGVLVNQSFSSRICIGTMPGNSTTRLAIHYLTGQFTTVPANTGHQPNAGWMLVRRLRRWPSIQPALGLLGCYYHLDYPGIQTRNSQLMK